MEQENREQHQAAEHKSSRTWGIFCHLGAFSIYIGVPLGNIIIPLIIWLVKKDELPQVDDQGKESLNFQLSLILYAILAIIAYGVLFMVVFLAAGEFLSRMLLIFIPLLVAFFIVIHLVLTIIGAIKAGEGMVYHYPLTIKFIR